MAKHNASTVSQTPSSVTSLAAMASSIDAPMIAGTSASPALQTIRSSEAKHSGLRSSRNIVVTNARPSGYVVDIGIIAVSSQLLGGVGPETGPEAPRHQQATGGGG